MSVQSAEPAVLVIDPAAPAVSEASKIGVIGEAGVDRLPGEFGVQYPSSPGSSPVLAFGRGGVAPRRGASVQRLEAGLPCPAHEAPSGIRFATRSPGESTVQREPLVQFRDLREPGEAGVVAVPYRDQPAGPADPSHLPQRAHRIAEVLQHLMGVHHVETVVVEVECVRVGQHEVDVRQSPVRRLGPRRRQTGVGVLHCGDSTGCNVFGEVGGDRSGPATDVQHRDSGREGIEQVSRRVLGGPGTVSLQHGFVVAMNVRGWFDGHVREAIPCLASQELVLEIWTSDGDDMDRMNGMDAATWNDVDVYFDTQLLPDDPRPAAAARAAAAAGLPAISVSPSQGRMLELYARMQGARRILEVGTLGAYSTIWLARGLAPDGHILTLEVNPEHARVATANLAQAGLTDVVEVRLGAAADSLSELVQGRAEPYDLIFVDADKESNPEYFRRAVELSRPGTLIIVDNVVRRGAVADAQSEAADVRGTRALIETVAAEPRVTAATVQTVGSKGYDGFALILVER